jgi:Fic family protein
MYIEKRKIKNKIKHYLVHSYRENTEVFNFYLTKNQLEKLNDYKVKIYHLDKINWKRFTEEFVYDTNAIEGSTVRLDEVKNLLENKKKPKDEDERETKNVAKAIEYVRKTKEELSINLIKKLHKICFKGTKPFAGKIRDVEVVIRDSTGRVVHAGVLVKELDNYLKEFIEWYGKNKNKFKPLVLAAIIHNQFEHIHPFQDGNGRVGRLLLNFILLKNNYPPININIEGRWEYYESLREYSKNQNLKPSVKFLINQYNKTLKEVTTK